MKTIFINGESGGAIGANTYVYYDERTLAGAVIDPGAEPHKIIEIIYSKNIDIRFILLTHGHFDHIAAVPHIKQSCNADICVLKEENIILSNPLFNASILFGNPMKLIADKFLNDGDEIYIGNETLKVIHTPGHTVGGACYYDKKTTLFSPVIQFFMNP